MLLTIAGCNLVMVTIVSNSTIEESNDWLAKYAISLAQDLLLTQFLKAFIQACLIKKAANYRNSSQWCKQCVFSLIDKLVLRSLIAS